MSAERAVILMEDDMAVSGLVNEVRDFIQDVQCGIVVLTDEHKRKIMNAFSGLMVSMNIELQVEEDMDF